jgi:preprotein translocase subunit YajC
MDSNALHLIGSFTVLLLAIGFIGFLFMISPEMRKMLKRNKKIEKRKNNIKQASKARDYQI